MTTTIPINLYVSITISCNNVVINRLHTSGMIPIVLLMRMHSSDVSAYFSMYDVTIEQRHSTNVYIFTPEWRHHVQCMRIAAGGKRQPLSNQQPFQRILKELSALCEWCYWSGFTNGAVCCSVSPPGCTNADWGSIISCFQLSHNLLNAFKSVRKPLAEK